MCQAKSDGLSKASIKEILVVNQQNWLSEYLNIIM
jgi:hypothetical protein